MGIVGITNLNQYVNMSVKKDSLHNKNISVLSHKKYSDEQKAKRLKEIGGKMLSGKKLSHDDMEFLRKHSPEDYKKAVKIEKEREEYRRALENCKTKDEVRILQAQKMAQIMTEIKAAKANKYCEQLLGFIMMKAAAILDEFIDFTKSDKYKDMPNEYEVILESKEKQDAQNEDNETDFEIENDNFTSETDNFETNNKKSSKDENENKDVAA